VGSFGNNFLILSGGDVFLHVWSLLLFFTLRTMWGLGVGGRQNENFEENFEENLT